jgi:SOS response associated peptidase (SRAP)
MLAKKTTADIQAQGGKRGAGARGLCGPVRTAQPSLPTAEGSSIKRIRPREQLEPPTLFVSCRGPQMSSPKCLTSHYGNCMCTRYVFTDPAEAIRDLFHITAPLPNWPPSYNVSPTHIMPVIRPIDGGRELAMMEWGLVPFFSKDGKRSFAMTRTTLSNLLRDHVTGLGDDTPIRKPGARWYSCAEALCEEFYNGSSARLSACRGRFGFDRLHADDRPSCLADWVGMARDFENELFRACSGRSRGLSAARFGGLVASKSVCRTIGRGHLPSASLAAEALKLQRRCRMARLGPSREERDP